MINLSEGDDVDPIYVTATHLQHEHLETFLIYVLKKKKTQKLMQFSYLNGSVLRKCSLYVIIALSTQLNDISAPRLGGGRGTNKDKQYKKQSIPIQNEFLHL